jgi:hypothetical protein
MDIDKLRDQRPGEPFYKPGTHPQEPIQDWSFRNKEVQKKGEIPTSPPLAEFGDQISAKRKRVGRRTPGPDKSRTSPVWKRPGNFAEEAPAERKERGWERYLIKMLDGEVRSVEGRIYDVKPDHPLINLDTPLSEPRVRIGRAANCSFITVGGEDEEAGGRADTYVVKRHPVKDEILEPRTYRGIVDGESRVFDLVSFPWIQLQVAQKSTS